MKLRQILATAAALAAGLTAAAQPSEWNVQYVKFANYGSPAAFNPRKIDIPDVGGYTTLKVDLHMHTINSDGDVSPRVRVQEAWCEGLDAIAITDHQPHFGKPDDFDYDQSYPQAINEAQDRGILLIRGLEISHGQNDIGHINLLFINNCNDYKIPQQFGAKETYQAIVQANEEGGWVMANHPGWPDENSELQHNWTSWIEAGLIQGMEVFNSYEFYPLAIDHCNKYNLAMMASSDQHRPMNFDYDIPRVMRPMTLVFAEDRSIEAIHEALKAGRTVAMSNNILAGRREWLTGILRASLKIERLVDRGTKFRIRIFNDSDIDYFFDCGMPSKNIRIPAHRYYDSEFLKTDLALRYKVTNMFVSSTECLTLPISMLFTPQSDIDMPALVDSDISYEAGTIYLPLMCQKGDTYYTLDGSEPTPDHGTLYTGPVAISGPAVLKARTFNGDKSSYTYTYPLLYLNATNAKVKKNGLAYSFYADPAIRSITSVAHLTPERFKYTGVTSIPSIQQHEEEDWFGYVFEGWIKAPKSGVYTFKLDTGDGSQLFLDDQMIIDMDYNKGNSVATGYAYLEEGLHKFRMPYFEGHVSEKIEVSWMLPGNNEFVLVPASAFFLIK